MNINKMFTVYKKELRDTLRDRRTLIAMIVLPMLLFPLLMSLMTQIQEMGSQKLSNEKTALAYLDEIPNQLDSLLQLDELIKITASSDPPGDLKNGRIQAYINIKAPQKTDSLFIYYDGAADRSSLAIERVEKVVTVYKRNIQESSLLEAGVDIALLDPLGLRTVNAAPPSRMAGKFMGLIIPMMLVIMLMMGAMYPAIDLTAGEKERGTLETILTVPIQRFDLLMGKLLTVSTIALITGILNLISIALVFSISSIQAGLQFTFSPLTLLMLFALTIPLALFISALMLSVCLFARSFKDGQNLINPLFIIILLPTFVGMMPGIELNEIMALIPILNIVLLFKEIMLQNFHTQFIFMVFLSNTLYAVTSILIFSKLFSAEQLLFGEGKGLAFSFKRSEIKPVGVFQPADALLIFTIIFIVLFYAGAFLFMKFKQQEHWAILITQWGLFFPAVIFAIWYNKVDFKKALNLKGFNVLSLLGSLLLLLGGWVFMIWIYNLQFTIFPEWREMADQLEKILGANMTSLNPLLAFFVLAVSPGVCEELIFRGILLSAFKERFSPAFAIIVVSLIFGLFHIHIFRLLPTALIGFYLTYIVYKTGSIYLGMIGHTLNNSLALLIMFNPGYIENMGWIVGKASMPIPVVIGMILLITSGYVLIRYSSREENSTMDRMVSLKTTGKSGSLA